MLGDFLHDLNAFFNAHFKMNGLNVFLEIYNEPDDAFEIQRADHPDLLPPRRLMVEAKPDPRIPCKITPARRLALQSIADKHGYVLADHSKRREMAVFFAKRSPGCDLAENLAAIWINEGERTKPLPAHRCKTPQDYIEAAKIFLRFMKSWGDIPNLAGWDRSDEITSQLVKKIGWKRIRKDAELVKLLDENYDGDA